MASASIRNIQFKFGIIEYDLFFHLSFLAYVSTHAIKMFCPKIERWREIELIAHGKNYYICPLAADE